MKVPTRITSEDPEGHARARRRASGSSYARTVLRRLPATLVSTNLALAGLLTISPGVIQWHINTCGLSAATVVSWRVIAVLGAS